MSEHETQQKMNKLIETLTEAKEEEAMGFEHQSYKTLIDFGKLVQPFPEKLRIEKFMIDKCTSTVYLVCTVNKNKMHFQGDSDAQFVKGELGMLISIFEGISPQELNSDVTQKQFTEFFEQLEGLVPISMNRKQGFVSMFERMKRSAKKL